MATPEFNLPDGRTWLHVTCRAGDDCREVWHSPVQDVTATRTKDLIEYCEHSTGTTYIYYARKPVLYRMPEYEPPRPTHYLRMAHTIPLIVREDKLPENLLDRLGFCGTGTADFELVSQSLSTLEVDGRPWLSYCVALKRRGTSDTASWEWRIDPKTKLLFQMLGSATTDGKFESQETQFAYLSEGPADIFDLGVLRSANLLDCELPPEIQNIVDTLKRDRQRMDDYRAIVTTRMIGLEYLWWIGHDTLIIYRKGDKFRVDTAHWCGGLSNYAQIEKPAEDADLEAWWRERVKVFTFVPFYASDDSKVCCLRKLQSTDAHGVECYRVESVDNRPECGKPDDVFPPYYGCSPEFACRPPLGLPRHACVPTLNPVVSENGHELLLLETVEMDTEPRYLERNDGQKILQPNVHRFWVDPARDFVAVRQDMVYVDENGKEQLIGSTLIEDFGQSPNGTWYAKRIRTKAVPPVEHDQVRTIYMDFNLDLPNSFFDPPRVGDTFQ